MGLKILHNPRCSKSRQTLAILSDNGIDVDIIEYLKDVPSEKTLRQIINIFICIFIYHLDFTLDFFLLKLPIHLRRPQLNLSRLDYLLLNLYFSKTLFPPESNDQ